jgi:hypothetical protein
MTDNQVFGLLMALTLSIPASVALLWALWEIRPLQAFYARRLEYRKFTAERHQAADELSRREALRARRNRMQLEAKTLAEVEQALRELDA